MARVGHAEHSDQPDTRDGKQIVARVAVTPAGDIGPTAQATSIVHTRVSEVAEQWTSAEAAMQRSVNSWKFQRHLHKIKSGATFIINSKY